MDALDVDVVRVGLPRPRLPPLAANSVLEAVGDLGDADAVLHDHVEVDVDAVVLDPNLDASVQVLALEALGDAVTEAPRGHSDDAVAAVGGVAGDRGDDLVGDLDAAPVLLLHDAVQAASELLVWVAVEGSQYQAGAHRTSVRIPA